MAVSKGLNMSIAIGDGAFLIPIKMEKVTKDSKTSLHEYHKTDMGRGGRKKYCKVCGEELETEDLIKGLEISKGKVVTFSKDELDSLPLPSTKCLDVDGFIEVQELNPLSYESSYFISPRDGSDRSLFCFTDGLFSSGKVAVGKMIMSSRENLFALRPMNGRLIMSIMCWEKELKTPPTSPKPEITENHKNLIAQVIGKWSKPFDYTSFSDHFDDALKEMAEKKLNGEDIVTTVAEQPPTQNLEDALQALVSGGNVGG